MTMYLGDYSEDETVYFLWSTNDDVGASITRATNGTISVYKDNGTTQSTAGITDTEDFDALTGIHACTIDTSADAFYVAGADYAVVLSGATIDGQAVNAVLAHFSIENRKPAVMLKDGTFGLAALETLVDELESRLTAARAGYLDNLNVGGNVASQTSLDTLDDYVDTEIAAIKAKTDQLNFTGTDVKATLDGETVTVATNNDKTGYVLSAIGSAAMTEDYAADGATATLNQLLYMIWSALSQFLVSGTTIQTKKLDGTTNAMAFTTDDATNPTQRIRSS